MIALLILTLGLMVRPGSESALQERVVNCDSVRIARDSADVARGNDADVVNICKAHQLVVPKLFEFLRIETGTIDSVLVRTARVPDLHGPPVDLIILSYRVKGSPPMFAQAVVEKGSWKIHVGKINQ
jgi:hypothetical protein